jgi:hypothetical protein
VKHRIEWNREREEKLKAESLAQEARWMMLSYQVNPHFLFNALNSIRALIGLNDEKARSIVTRMSEYFRYSLSIEHKTLVSLNEEIAAVDSYLEIQMIRYSERLQIIKAIEESTLQCLIPVFTIQTLIENAIKYGLKTHPGVVDIEIRISHLEEKLHIRISNTGKLVDTMKRHGDDVGTQTGLENLKGKSPGRRREHLVRHVTCTAGHDAQPESGEDVRIVSLPWHQPFSLVLDRIERTAAGENRAPCGPIISLGRGTLGHGGRIGKREDDRPIVDPRHLLHHFTGERAAYARDPDDTGRLQRLNRRAETG